MELKYECIHKTNDKQIVCAENKRKIIFFNNRGIYVEKILIDGCQITEGKRCDYLVVYDKRQNFIELKGNKLDSALEQLERTIKLIGINDYYKYAYVVSSRSPLSSAEIQNKKLTFKRKFNTTLEVKNNIIQVEIN